MIRRVVLHIGLHKTGTTSFQVYVQRNPMLFKRNCVEVYKPRYHKTSAANEIGIALLRPGVIDELYRGLWSVPESAFEKSLWHEEIKARLQYTCANSLEETLLISGEHLSFFRTPEEVSSLRALFPECVEEFKVFVVERDRSDWWRSYCSQVRRSGILEQKRVTQEYNSWVWLDPKGWLTDFDTIYKIYSTEFGQITKLRFSKNIIPELLDAMGIEGYSEVEVYENRRVRPFELKRVYKRWLSRTVIGSGWRSLKRVIGR